MSNNIKKLDITNPIKYINLDEIATDIRMRIKSPIFDDNKHDNVNKINNNLKDNEQSVVFQILDWNAYHEETDDGRKLYAIRLFGRIKDGRTITVFVEKYTPYFYVEIPSHWRMAMIDTLVQNIKKKVFPKENVDGLLNYQTVSKYKFYGFTNYTKFNFIQFTFKNRESMKSYEKVFKKPLKIFQISKEEFHLQLYESNIEPFLRCMHIRGLDAVGWVSIDPQKYTILNTEPTQNDINISCDWFSLNRIEDRSIQSFTIASFDIECTSCDGSFPQAYRDNDKIIQIGTTFMKFGETECYYQHIITLGSCDSLPGIDVESYDTEQEVLLAWVRLINRMNPDIITGYNIVGFDLEYMKDRSKKLGIEDKFSKLTRVKNQRAEWKESNLSSSALGMNVLKYYEMTGRVLIDMMKVIQRDHKLESYRLEFAAAWFIKEQVQKLTLNVNSKDKKTDNHQEFGDVFIEGTTIMNENSGTSTIETKNTYGMKEDHYVSIYYTDGIALNKHMDGKKFKVKYLTQTSLTVEGIIDDSIMKIEGWKVYWCHTKDDISPQDIFRLQRGTSKDRAIVAKYCIQDCSLVCKLMVKLHVLTNNIGMANVCNVPLSYLFMRGQGVKIFSLVSKKCREKNHLIPTLVKEYKSEEEVEIEEKEDKKLENLISKLNGDEDVEEEEESYEGAIVFPPKPSVYYEPIPVLDYASLYPKSMICKNLSHECCVMDDATYGSIPGYKYHIISYTTSEFNQDYDRKLLNKVLIAYDNNNDYIVEEQKVDPSKLRRHMIIYDKYSTGLKRWKVSEILVTKDKINVKNFETSKFAEKEDGTKGIIPEILNDLLSARSKYKKEMEIEKDSFVKAIIDGLQQAYKITANSLYGQCGASTSQICMKRIAASTTAVGRDMLIFSKYFIENIYGKMINLALEDKIKYIEYCKETFKEALANKFKAPNKGWNTREEFYEAFYNKMTSLLNGKTVNPYIIYGDSVSYDTPIMIKNSSNKLEIKQIKDLGTEWIKYDSFKSDIANEYFEGILKTLLKTNHGVNLWKHQYLKEQLINVSDWFSRQYLDKCVKMNDCINIVNCIDIKQSHEFIRQTIEQFGIFNRIRIKLDTETREIFLEVGLTHGFTMLCDIEDIDIINKKEFYTDSTNLNITHANKYHILIISKLFKKLPKVVRSQIESLSIEHINQNIFDNRKKNLRLVEFRDQTWNIDILYDKLMKDIIDDQKQRFCKEQSFIDFNVFTNNGWSKINRLIRHKTNKKMFRIITSSGVCDVTEDHSLLDKDNKLIKPKDCKVGTELLHAFPVNYEGIHHDIDKEYYNLPFYTTNNKLDASKYHFMSKQQGYNVKISYIESVHDNVGKLNDIYILLRTNEQVCDANKIIKIVILDEIKDDSEYVYDIETESGRFNAGIGEMVVSNTDSIFFNCHITDNITKDIGRDKVALEQCIQLGIWASYTICLLLPDPQEQCYEKVLWPFMILSKKRYVGNLYEKDPNKFYQKSMGIVLKRRDNAQIVKIVCGGIVDKILNKRDNIGAINLTQTLLKDILSGKFPMDKFIIAKTLKGHALTETERITESLKSKEKRIYVDRTRIVHAVLADRMADRDPGNKPMPNDRIPYAYVIVDKKVELQGDHVEHPEFIISEGLKLDYLFYITNQIQKPATQFLELIVEQPNKIFESYIIKEKNRRQGKKPIKSYLKMDDDCAIDNNNNNEKLEDNSFTDDTLMNEMNETHKNVNKRQKSKGKRTKCEIKEDESFSLD